MTEEDLARALLLERQSGMPRWRVNTLPGSRVPVRVAEVRPDPPEVGRARLESLQAAIDGTEAATRYLRRVS